MENRTHTTETQGEKLAHWLKMHYVSQAFTVESLESLQSMRTILLVGLEKTSLFEAIKARIASEPIFAAAFKAADEYLGTKDGPYDVEALDQKLTDLHNLKQVVVVRTYSPVIRELLKTPNGREQVSHALTIRSFGQISEGEAVHNLSWQKPEIETIAEATALAAAKQAINGEERQIRSVEDDVDALLEALEMMID